MPGLTLTVMGTGSTLARQSLAPLTSQQVPTSSPLRFPIVRLQAQPLPAIVAMRLCSFPL